MASVAQAKSGGSDFSNHEEVVRVIYDFAKDGGATGALDIFTANAAMIITHFSAVVKTTATSGGSATLKVGVTGSDALFMSTVQGAVASLVANAAIYPLIIASEGTPNTLAVPLPVKLASGDKVLQTIGTAALTAGKVEYCIKYLRA